MPSSYTARLRFELQAAGENLNTWGAPKLNNVISRIDFSIAGWTTKALTGDYVLTSSNGDDEARSAMLKFTGTGAFFVTIPSVSKRYDVWNALTDVLTVTTGSGDAATVQAGEKVSLICDGTNVYRAQPTDFGGARITNVADPTSAQDAATKAYADALAFTANAGILPGQTGNAGLFLTTNGAVASWSLPLPDQTGNVGKVLKTDGSAASWQTLVLADISNFAYALKADIWAASSAVKVPTPFDLYDAAASESVADAATITLDGAAGINFHILLTAAVGATRALGNPSNFKAGQSGRIRFQQPSSGGPCAVTKGANYRISGGSIALSSAANAVDCVGYFVHSATDIELYPSRALS